MQIMLTLKCDDGRGANVVVWELEHLKTPELAMPYIETLLYTMEINAGCPNPTPLKARYVTSLGRSNGQETQDDQE